MRCLPIFMIAAIGLSGCASLYDGPSKSDPHANISFVKGYLGGQSAIAAYAQENSTSCNIDKHATIAKLGPLHKKPTTKRVSVGGSMSLLATFIKYENTGQIINGVAGLDVRTSCFSRVNFNPENGRKYRAHLVEKTDRTCELSFVDEETNQTPQSAVITDGVRCINGSLSK